MDIGTREIEVTLGGNNILKGINLEVTDNKVIGIIGPNGSGKSTLLKCMYRVLEPSVGAVFLDGRTMKQWPVRQSAQKIAVVAQHNFYNFDFTVRDVVLMGRAPHKRALERDTAEDYEIVEESLRQVSMDSFADRSFSTLSGGEQQRVILARALAQRTPCLILDEPTNHLDIKYQLELMNTVRGLDCTVIAAIHDLNIAAMYCDEIYAMKDGKMISSGTPKEVLTHDLISEIYEVGADIIEDKNGQLHVLYHPSNCGSCSL